MRFPPRTAGRGCLISRVRPKRETHGYLYLALVRDEGQSVKEVLFKRDADGWWTRGGTTVPSRTGEAAYWNR